MKAEELLHVIGEANEEYIRSAMENREGNAQPDRWLLQGRFLLIAAMVALMLFLLGCAVAAMRLQHLTIRDDFGDEDGIKPVVTGAPNGNEEITQSGIPGTTESTTPPATDMNGEEINLISLQGYMGSDSYAAFKEWREFLDTYDPDKRILYANDKTFQCPETHTSYHCYSQEMVDKVDAICEKYHLEPLGKYWLLSRGADVLQAVGVESVFSGSQETGFLDFSGYCFGDGTFSLEGRLELTGEWSSMVLFNYRSVKKTAFDGVAMNIGDVEKYDQWNYTMTDGTRVLLAIRDEGALIVADREDSFITIGISGEFTDGRSCRLPAEREYLETLCEAFDFTYQANPVDPAKADELYRAQLEREARGESDRKKYQINYDYPDTYAGIIDFMVKEQKYTGLNYALIDVDGDGVEEMLLQCVNLVSHDGSENSFFSIYTMTDGEPYGILSVKRSNLYLCQGGVFDQAYSDTEGHYYYHFLPKFEYLEYVGYNAKDGEWYTDGDGHGNDSGRIAITKEAAGAIIAKYPRVDIVFQPVSEFPR